MSNADIHAAVEEGYVGLDRLFEHRVRFAIAVLLARETTLSFARFKDLLGESDGNLGAQLRKLEDEGAVAVEKRFVGRKPQSLYRLTEEGAKRLSAHLDALDRLIAAGRND
ncbi:MAG: transcriptional regulator [Rhodothalassiaceae bacterium]